MKKLSIAISPEEWGSLITKYRADSKKLTLADFTEGTVNADTDVAGTLTKRKGGPNYNPTLLPASPKDQFEAIFSDGARHLLVAANGEIRYSSGDTIFNTVVNGTGFSTLSNFEFATTQDRVYGGNGVNSPIVYDRNPTYGGVVYTAPRIKVMGVQAPGTAPTAGTPTAGGSVPNGAHTYKVTFLYYDAEESNGSPASGVQTAGAGNNTIPLTAIPIGGYGVTARKIYRDNNDGLYLHIGTLADNTTTVFSDTVAVGATPTEIPEFNNAPPTFGLITTWLDKQWLAKVPGDPSTLFYTETGMPDIVRPENQLLCNQEDPITAFIVYFGRLVVFNRRSMGQILGSTPDTFRYSAIPSSIGCVDNRTLQIRVIEGVPVLIWLSDRGFYSYDGNAINYISDEIEDLVNFNIQQATQQKNSNTQTSQTQFQSGTASQGIDLLSVPGSITTKGYADGTALAGTNPRRTYNDQSDWEGGSSELNVATRDGSNALKAVTRFAPTIAAGTHQGTILDSGLIKLPVSTALFGENSTLSTITTHLRPSSTVGKFYAMAVPIIPARSGTLTAIKFSCGAGQDSTSTNRTFTVSIRTDTGSGPSGTVLGSGSISTDADSPLETSSALSVALTGGVKYWMVIQIGASNIAIGKIMQGTTLSGGSTMVQDHDGFNNPVGSFYAAPFNAAAGYNFSYTPISGAGTWVSPIHDTNSVSTGGQGTVSFSTFSIPNSSVTKVGATYEVSDDGVNFTTHSTQPPISFQPFTFSLTNKRYWRLRITLTTTDTVFTPAVSAPILTFVANQVSQPAEWISEAIDCTADVTAYTGLTSSVTTPAGTSVEILIATSTDDISYSGFTTVGSAIVRRYVKIRARLVMDGSQSTSPTITSITFTWTIVANLISSIIDTAVNPPAGWDIFLSSFTLNGGTVQFQMRSATTSGGIPAATFFTVTPNEFPNAVTPNQFVQWKVIITSNDNDVPVVDSVTVQWFISNVASIRPASIFVDSRYYIALALLNESTNTVLLELDLNGKWRRHRGLAISTFSYFFNRPYFGLATSGQIRKFLEGLTDAGAAIEFDVRFKATDYSTRYEDHSSKVKVVGEAILQGTNTGATYQLFYSVDLGQTFYPMYTSDGNSSFVSSTDGQNFYVRFRPLWDGSTPIAGRTIMYRVYSNDLNEVEIKSLDATAFLRLQSPVITG